MVPEDSIAVAVNCSHGDSPFSSLPLNPAEDSASASVIPGEKQAIRMGVERGLPQGGCWLGADALLGASLSLL